MTAVPDLNRTTDLAVLGTTTVGYYLVNDLVKKPALRRVAGAAVLATGAAAAVERGQRARADAAARRSARRTPYPTAHGDAGKGPQQAATGTLDASATKAARAAQAASAAETTGRGGTGAAEVSATPSALSLVGAAAAAVGAAIIGSWVNKRIDRAVTTRIARIGGKLPLVGGLFRRFPSALWGLTQFGAVVGLERATRSDAPTSAVARAAATRAGAQQ